VRHAVFTRCFAVIKESMSHPGSTLDLLPPRVCNKVGPPMGINEATEPTEPNGDCESARPSGVNLSMVSGEIVTNVDTRVLPSGVTALSFSVTVRVLDEKTTSVPVVWYDPPKAAQRWGAGDRVIVHGSVVRRFFRGGAGLGSSTEVVVKHGALIRHRSKSRAVALRAAAIIETALAIVEV